MSKIGKFIEIQKWINGRVWVLRGNGEMNPAFFWGYEHVLK
jgi:hypothetical protein